MRTEPSKADLERQKRISKEFKAFRKKFLFSQQDLASALGVSRRAVQYVESGNRTRPDWACIPHTNTLARFRALRTKHEKEAK